MKPATDTRITREYLSYIKEYKGDWGGFNRFTKKKLKQPSKDFIKEATQAFEEVLTNLETKRLVDIKNGGWIDGLKYAKALIDENIFCFVRTKSGLKVVSRKVKNIQITHDSIKFIVDYPLLYKNNVELDIKEYGKKWSASEADLLEIIKIIRGGGTY